MTLPVVISDPEAAIPGKVDKLVKFCHDFDDTEVLVNKITKAMDAEFIAACHGKNVFFQQQAWALRLEAEMMKGKPFIHLEPDSLPIKRGWAKMISDEYVRLERPYLWAWDQHPPGDLCGGIGVYGPDTAHEIPCQLESRGWDGWMLDNIPGKIARSPLLQHQYGLYDAAGVHKVRDLRFPLDSKLIRPETVLFHRDPSQSLMHRGNYRYEHSGCIGDSVAAMKTIQLMGGGHLVMSNRCNKRELRGPRYEWIKPLLEAQPYIKSVTWEEEPEGIDISFCKFRETYEPQHSLAWTQARYVGLDLTNVDPWLFVEPSPLTKGKIVAHRSHRYRSAGFPWKLIRQEFGERLVFVGLPEERENLEAVMGGFKLLHLPTPNALEMAKLIAGADCFVGNQSSPFWIAAGLGKRLLQETWNEKPDSIIAKPGFYYYRSDADVDMLREVLK